MHINTVNQTEILTAAAKTYAVIFAARTRRGKVCKTQCAER